MQRAREKEKKKKGIRTMCLYQRVINHPLETALTARPNGIHIRRVSSHAIPDRGCWPLITTFVGDGAPQRNHQMTLVPRRRCVLAAGRHSAGGDHPASGSGQDGAGRPTGGSGQRRLFQPDSPGTIAGTAIAENCAMRTLQIAAVVFLHEAYVLLIVIGELAWPLVSSCAHTGSRGTTP